MFAMALSNLTPDEAAHLPLAPPTTTQLRQLTTRPRQRPWP
jgi:hypothetical protein